MKTAKKASARMQDMTVGDPLKLLIAFAMPMLIGNLFQQVYTMIDTMEMGYFVGDDAISAVGAVSALYNLLMSLVISMNNGFAIPVTQAFGSHNEKRLRRSIAGMLILNGALVVIATTLSVVFLGERLTARKCLCAAAALFGMSLVAGFWSPNAAANSTMVGLLQALGAAGFYAALILNNKFIGRTVPVDPLDSALVQLFMAALVLVPYVTAVVDFSTIRPDALSLGLTLVVAVLHTAVAYWLFFSAIPKLDAARIAVFAYVDPATAILLSILLLKEPFTLASVGGALLILGAAAALEFGSGRKP